MSELNNLPAAGHSFYNYRGEMVVVRSYGFDRQTRVNVTVDGIGDVWGLFELRRQMRVALTLGPNEMGVDMVSLSAGSHAIFENGTNGEHTVSVTALERGGLVSLAVLPSAY